VIVWGVDIPPEEYVRCTVCSSGSYVTRGSLKRFLGAKCKLVYVRYEAVPSDDKRYMLLLRYFFLTRRDHFFKGVGLRPDEWWSDPNLMPSEGVRVRDIKPAVKEV
jgi:hypothetical protein